LAFAGSSGAKVRGDGREYTLNLCLNKRLTAVAYRAAVQTEKDEWIEIRVPLDEFEATSFGRVVKGSLPQIAFFSGSSSIVDSQYPFAVLRFPFGQPPDGLSNETTSIQQLP